MSSSSPSPKIDIASMSAARSSKNKRNAPPTKHRDGFHLIPNDPIVYDLDLTSSRKENNNKQQKEFTDITYKISSQDKVARIAFNRPEKLHSFRPQTINEIREALQDAADNIDVAVIILTSENDMSKKQSYTPAFCAGGDQTVRSNDGGYDDGTEQAPRLRVLDLQIEMRRCFKPILCVVDGYAIGGGHILHMCSDITLASSRSVFGQTGPRMGSFDSGYGSTRMARLIGQKKAREMWFLCRFYDAKEAKEMGLINDYFSHKELEGEVAKWVRRIVMNSPTAIACTKASLNADEDGAAGISLMGGHMTRLFYLSKESQEGRDAFINRRSPEFRKLPSARL